MKAQWGSTVEESRAIQLYSFFNFGAIWWKVVNATPWPF
jgi:hypothetical protein